MRIDTDGRVLDMAQKPIPGLYAAGELVGGLFYFNYPGGTGLVSGSVFGKIAGTTAGRQVGRNMTRASGVAAMLDCVRTASAATATCRPIRRRRGSVRMNALLPRLRRGRTRRALSELRRRVGAASDPAGRPAVAPSGLDRRVVKAAGCAPAAGGRNRDAARTLAPRLVPPFLAMDMLRAASAREAQGHSVIHLEVGQPGTPAPEAVLDAARAALATDRIGYTDSLGIPELREAIARHYGEQYGVAVDPDEVVVTTGSSAAFQLIFIAAFEPGDRVALAAPGYPAYRNILSALALEPVLIEVGPNANYQPNLELLEACLKERGTSPG